MPRMIRQSRLRSAMRRRMACQRRSRSAAASGMTRVSVTAPSPSGVRQLDVYVVALDADWVRAEGLGGGQAHDPAGGQVELGAVVGTAQDLALDLPELERELLVGAVPLAGI